MDVDLELAAVFEAPALAALARRVLHSDRARLDSDEPGALAPDLVHGQ